MELSGPLILLVVTLLLVILVASLYARHLATKDLRLFRSLAEKRKGKVKIDSFTSWATVVFTDDEKEVTVYQQKGVNGKREWTCIKLNADLPDQFALHVGKADADHSSVLSRWQWLMIPEATVGSDTFRASYTVHGNNDEFLQRLFTGEFQKGLLQKKKNAPTLTMQLLKPITKGRKNGSYPHSLEYTVRKAPGTVEEMEKVINSGLKALRSVLNSAVQ